MKVPLLLALCAVKTVTKTTWEGSSFEVSPFSSCGVAPLAETQNAR